jgi:hypothetical protein
MPTKAFVKACRGADGTEPELTPLSWLHTAIITLSDPDRAVAARAEDPDAYLMMLRQLEDLHRDLSAALAVEDARNPEITAARKQQVLFRLRTEGYRTRREPGHRQNPTKFGKV